MRIIAGQHRTRTILPPPDAQTTRPITDRVKESLFNSLMARGLPGELPVLDIFAGTGTLGLEALSRGASHCTFIERDRRIRNLLETNVASLKLEPRATVLAVDALVANLPALVRHVPLGVVFCDPPYKLMREAASLERVMRLVTELSPLMEPDGVLMLRTPSEVQLPAVTGWPEPRSRRFGSMTVHLYERDDGE